MESSGLNNRINYKVLYLYILLYYIFDIIIWSLHWLQLTYWPTDWLILQTSEISPFKYKINVIQRLLYDWLNLKSWRSAVGGYTRTNQILYHLIKLLLVITPSIFIRLTRKYHNSNPLIETVLMSTKSQRLDHPFPKYLESSPIIIYMRYVNPN